MAHPGTSQIAHDFVVPSMPGGSGGMATLTLHIIRVVGTTVAPWQLFFQQSYVFPGITAGQIVLIIEACGGVGILAAGYAPARRRKALAAADAAADRTDPPGHLHRPQDRMGALRLHLLIAMILVIVEIVQLAISG